VERQRALAESVCGRGKACTSLGRGGGERLGMGSGAAGVGGDDAGWQNAPIPGLAVATPAAQAPKTPAEYMHRGGEIASAPTPAYNDDGDVWSCWESAQLFGGFFQLSCGSKRF
jgi:hypothetical protein